jgi:tRNA A37 methylthiotransferase MiaB
MREKTHAHRRMEDSVPTEIKLKRTTKMNDIFLKYQEIKTKAEKGNIHLVLVDSKGKL